MTFYNHYGKLVDKYVGSNNIVGLEKSRAEQTVILMQDNSQTNKVAVKTHVSVPVVGPLELEDLARLPVVIMPDAEQPSAEFVQVRLQIFRFRSNCQVPWFAP